MTLLNNLRINIKSNFFQNLPLNYLEFILKLEIINTKKSSVNWPLSVLF
jgi:hypothetical protein